MLIPVQVVTTHLSQVCYVTSWSHDETFELEMTGRQEIEKSYQWPFLIIALTCHTQALPQLLLVDELSVYVIGAILVVYKNVCSWIPYFLVDAIKNSKELL